MQERFLLHCDRGASLVPIDSPNEGRLLQQAQLAGLQDGEIGRASRRARVELSVVAGALKKKK